MANQSSDLTTSKFKWDAKFNTHLNLQRNHKTFDSASLGQFVKLSLKEIAVIDSFITIPIRNVLDIGCGLGMYDIAINEYYQTKLAKSNAKTPTAIKFHMLDKTTTPIEEHKVYYGHQPVACFYNNLDYTRELLTMNGINTKSISTISVCDTTQETNKALLKLPKMDLIVSIISMGFHYPVTTYLDSVHELLNEGGLFCFHCRTLQNFLALQNRFTIVHPSLDKIKDGCLVMCKKVTNKPQ